MKKSAHAARMVGAFVVLFAISSGYAYAQEGFFDRIKNWFSGSSASNTMASTTGAMPSAQSAPTEAQAKALCDDLQAQTQAAQEKAILARMPPKSPAQVINNDYGVLDILNTPIDVGGLISGGLSGLISDITNKVAQAFVNKVVYKAQDSFRSGMNDVLAKYNVPGAFQGTVDRATNGVTGIVNGGINGAASAGTEAIYSTGKVAGQTAGNVAGSAANSALNSARTTAADAIKNSGAISTNPLR